MTQVMETPDQFDIHGAALSRRGFLGVGGVMLVMLGLPAGRASAQTNSLDAAKPASWIEIHADSTVTMRTGKCDFGQSSIYTAYRQIVAEELGMSVEAITTVVAGDTDRTPDGGGTFGLLRNAGTNMRKAAAYTREAVLELAAQRFGVPRSAVSVAKGVITGGGKSDLWRNHCGPDLAPDHTHRRLAHRFSRAGGHRQSAAQKTRGLYRGGQARHQPDHRAQGFG
jgi:CO/xanthine dehydrogenase Mo-binding subunit